MKRLLKIADDKRSRLLNVMLGTCCAFVAGAINAGGFLILGSYTSHISGTIAGISDAVVLGNAAVVWLGFSAVGSFFLGAFMASVLIQIAQARKLHSSFALALLCSGCVLIALGVWATFSQDPTREQLVLLLGFFFSMGMQNATVSRLSNYETRATHMTGVVTDIGIELGKWISRSASYNREKLIAMGLILSAFLGGGILGAIAMKSVLGTLSICLFGGVLVSLALFPVYRDTHIRMRYLKKAHHRKVNN